MPAIDARHGPRGPGPGRALVAAVLPAYLFPAATTFLNALVIPDPQVADRLRTASWSTIAIPSAVAAGLVTLWLHRRRPPARPVAATSLRASGLAALGCGLLALAGTAVLIGNGVLDLSALQFTVTSAAVGGGLAARRWARTGRRRGRTRSPHDTHRTVTASDGRPATWKASA